MCLRFKYTGWRKTADRRSMRVKTCCSILLHVTSPNAYRFMKLFHVQTQQQIFNGVVISDHTTP